MIDQKVDHLLEQLQKHQGSDNLLVGASSSGRDPQLTFGSSGSWTSWAGWRVTRVKPEEQTCLLRELQDLTETANKFLQTRDIKATKVETLKTETQLTKTNVVKQLEAIKSSHKYAYDMTLDALSMAYMDHSHLGSDAEITQAVTQQVLEKLGTLPPEVMKAILPGALRAFAGYYEGAAVKDVCAIIATTYDVEFTPPVNVRLAEPRAKPAAIEATPPGINGQPLREIPQPSGQNHSDHQAAALPQNGGTGEMTEEQRRVRDWEALAGTQVVRQHDNLGKGHYGTVSLIEDGLIERARKTPHNPTSEVLENMEWERQVMSRLNHPHILSETGNRPVTERIKVVVENDVTFDKDSSVAKWGVAAEQDEDAFVVVESVDDGLAGIQTEVVDGGDLGLKGGLYQSLSWEKRLECCQQLLEAIAYMHDEGVAHLDLKPDNILYSRRDGVKVSDFGLAQRMYQTANGPNQIHNGGFIAMSHAAPEWAKHKELDGFKADAWSLAVTMAELLTGDSPMLSDVVVKGFERACPKHAPYGFVGLLTENEIEQGTHSFLARQGQTLGPLRDMFWDMFSPDPKYRMTAREALDKYGHLLQEDDRS